MEAGSLECHSVSFVWVVDKFLKLFEACDEDSVESPEFFIQNVKLMLRFDKLDPGESQVTIDLVKLEDPELELDLLTVSLVAEDGSEEVLSQLRDVAFLVQPELEVGRFYRLSLHPKFLSDDKLRIRCQIHSKKRPVENVPHLSDDLRKGLANLGFCDAVLVSGDRDFNVHRFILASRSPVFVAMFSHTEPVDGKPVRVVIEDVAPETLDALITFAYTDQVENEALTFPLLVAADKYDLQGLRARCEQELIQKLNVKNAVDLFLGAYLVQATFLKKSAANFIIGNHSAVKNIDLIANQRPEAMLEIFEMACHR